MRGVVALVSIVAAGCGRFGFGGDEPADAATIDGAGAIDADTTDAAAIPNLTAYYTMDDDPTDGTIDDATGNGRSAKCVVGLTCPTQAIGRSGSALQFDGVAQLARVTHDSVFDTPDELTIAAWIYLDDDTVDQVAFAKPHGAGADDSWGIVAWTTGPTCLETTTASGRHDACGSVALPAATWFHVAGTWDGVEKVFYIDGVRVGQNPLTDAVIFDNHDIVIGGDENGGTLAYAWHGRVDELRLYDSALSAIEIDALAQ